MQLIVQCSVHVQVTLNDKAVLGSSEARLLSISLKICDAFAAVEVPYSEKKCLQ